MNLRKGVFAGVGAVALTVGGWAGWEWWTDWRFVVSTDNAYVEADAAVIAPKVAGYVDAVLVGDNQLVHAGDPLVVIDDAEFAARSAAAHAAADAAAARVGTAQRQLELQRTLIDKATAGVASAEAELSWAESQFGRSEQLAKERWASRERFDEARAGIARAQAGLESARAELEGARGEFAVREAAVKEAVALRGQAEAQAKVADADLAGARLVAPVDGVVGNKSVQVGQYVREGTQLLVVVPLPEVHVVANFKETQLHGLKPGQPVEIRVDAFPDVAVEGRLESFAPASGAVFSLLPPENATGNFTKIVQRVPVRIAVPADNPLRGMLRPGLSVEVAIDTRSAGDPDAAVAEVFGAAPQRELRQASGQPAEAGEIR